MKLRPRSYKSSSVRPWPLSAGGVVLEDVWGEAAGGQDAQDGLDDGRDLGDGEGDVDRGLEVDADDGDALIGLGLGVLDVVDGGGEGALADGDDAAFHLGGRQARVAPDDGDDRDIDVGEDVLGGLNGRTNAEQEDQERHDDKCVRTPQRQLYDPHVSLGGGTSAGYDAKTGSDDCLYGGPGRRISRRTVQVRRRFRKGTAGAVPFRIGRVFLVTSWRWRSAC
jgi:hypothetical protein